MGSGAEGHCNSNERIGITERVCSNSSNEPTKSRNAIEIERAVNTGGLLYDRHVLLYCI